MTDPGFNNNGGSIRNRGDDRLPLVAVNHAKKGEGSKKGCGWWIMPVGLLVVVGLIYFLTFRSATAQSLVDTLSKPSRCRDECSSEPLDTTDMIQKILKGKNVLVEQLKKDYGEKHYNLLFQDPDAPQIDGETLSRGYTLFVSANTPLDKKEPVEELSRARFQRKLMMKLLRVNNKNGCDCGHLKESTSFPSFVWSTGGHSAAAGHGNFYLESYTMVMDKMLKPILKEVGIDFEGRNYAIGGMQSGPEMALCAEAIYGLDADVISWDFGMTDSAQFWKKTLYDYRIANHRNRPAMVDINVHNDHLFYGWNAISKKLEDAGMTSLYMKPVKEGEKHEGFLKENVPDMFGMSQEEIDAIPPYVRNFKCQDKVEEGDPTCKDAKYTNTYMNNETSKHLCDNSKHRAPWHPGWRFHALYGNWLSLFFMDHLLLAAKQLVRENATAATLYDRLLKEEDEDYRLFREQASSILTNNELLLQRLDQDIINHVDDIYTSTLVLCHTAILPSETRYLGHMMNHDGPTVYRAETYTTFEGISREEADNNNNNATTSDVPDMPLVKTDFLHLENCPATVLVDFDDYFYAHDQMGWTKIVTPNPREMKAYLKKPSTLKGIVVVCMVKCDWGECPKGDMRGIHHGHGLQIKVNGKDVVKMLRFGENCNLLEGPEGSFGTDLPYRVEVKVIPNATQQHANYVRISSVSVL